MRPNRDLTAQERLLQIAKDKRDLLRRQRSPRAKVNLPVSGDWHDDGEHDFEPLAIPGREAKDTWGYNRRSGPRRGGPRRAMEGRHSRYAEVLRDPSTRRAAIKTALEWYRATEDPRQGMDRDGVTSRIYKVGDQWCLEDPLLPSDLGALTYEERIAAANAAVREYWDNRQKRVDIAIEGARNYWDNRRREAFRRQDREDITPEERRVLRAEFSLCHQWYKSLENPYVTPDREQLTDDARTAIACASDRAHALSIFLVRAEIELKPAHRVGRPRRPRLSAEEERRLLLSGTEEAVRYAEERERVLLSAEGRALYGRISTGTSGKSSRMCPRCRLRLGRTVWVRRARLLTERQTYALTAYYTPPGKTWEQVASGLGGCTVQNAQEAAEEAITNLALASPALIRDFLEQIYEPDSEGYQYPKAQRQEVESKADPAGRWGRKSTNRGFRVPSPRVKPGMSRLQARALEHGSLWVDLRDGKRIPKEAQKD
jgi:hypothetical protein